MGLSPDPAYIAVDLGAESGRVIRGTVGAGGVALEEVHRFANIPVRAAGRLAWDLETLVREVVAGIGRAGAARSLSVDSWAVDYGLLDDRGALVAAPRCYRDPWLDGALDILLARVPAAEVYRRTGIQMMQINTLCQLAATAARLPAELARGRRLLMIPDLVRHALGCEPRGERTNAGSTQALGLDGAWADDLLERVGVPAGIMPELDGPYDPAGVTRGLGGADGIRVVAGASHDTAAAVVGTPLPSTEGEAVFISCGTWSLVWLELGRTVATEEARALNLSNEHGVGATTRLLRNVMGLWLLQRCRAEWGVDDHHVLAVEAAAAPAFGAIVNPDDPSFLNPPSMLEALSAFYRRTGQAVPGSRGGIVRSILESLALRHRCCIDALATVSGMTARAVHLVGGGSRNHLLCQLTADATGLPVHAGPAEATATGNIVVQAIADGTLANVAEARELIRAAGLVTFEPGADDRWEPAFTRFLEIADGRL